MSDAEPSTCSVTDVTVPLDEANAVPGRWIAAPGARASIVLAHGAGTGMNHRSMAGIADGLARRGVSSLRFEFPYMARGSRRPDPPAVAQAAVRAAVTQARRLCGALPLFAGGRSFGGRMTSQAQAAAPLEGVRGLVFFAFPLHPAGKPSTDRAAHLGDVQIPMLFLQGSRDALALPDLLGATVEALARANLHVVEGADHSFHVPASSGRKDADVLDEILDRATAWMKANLPSGPDQVSTS